MEKTGDGVSNPRISYFSEEDAEQSTPANNFITNFFQSRSNLYFEWLDIRQRGANNNTIQTFFHGKAQNPNADFRDNKILRSPNYLQEQFRKFRLHFRDVDMDLNISSEIQQRCAVKRAPESFTFLEFGFAPGAVTTFILDINWRIRGAGVTLPVDLGGYDVSPYLQSESRFQVVWADLVEEAKNGRKLLSRPDLFSFQSPEFSGFDLIINGITVHRHNHRNVKAELSLAQLYYALTLLRDGGMLLVVLNAKLDFFYLQYLYILFKVFDKCTAVKPVVLFPIRQSFRLFCTGFSKQRLQNWNLTEALREVLTSAKGLAMGDLGRYYDDIYYLGNQFPFTGDNHRLDIAKMISVKWGARIIELMTHVWERQKESIKQVLEGKKWQVCDRGNSCRKRQCVKAHSEDELITVVRDKLKKLDVLKTP